MGGVYWDERETKLLDYSALCKSKGTVVNIKLETDNPYELASIISALKQAMEKQAELVKPRPAKPSRPPKPIAQRPLLALEFRPKGAAE